MYSEAISRQNNQLTARQIKTIFLGLGAVTSGNPVCYIYKYIYIYIYIYIHTYTHECNTISTERKNIKGIDKSAENQKIIWETNSIVSAATPRLLAKKIEANFNHR